MWLQFEAVRGPVGDVWGRFGAGFGPKGPKPAPNRPQRTSGHLNSAELKGPQTCLSIRPEIFDFEPDVGPKASAIYGCGYNSCGCNLKLSEVRSGSFGVDLGPVWGPKGFKPPGGPNL